MHDALILCGKELKDLARSRALTVLVLFLAAVVLLSVLVAAANYRSRIEDYNNYVAALTLNGGSASGPPPELSPLPAWNTWKS